MMNRAFRPVIPTDLLSSPSGMSRSLVSAVLTVLFVAMTGCTAPRTPGSDAAAPLIDSLQAENTVLRDRLRHLEDSLQFRENIKSGQYHRELRTLEDQLNRLTYEVRALRDGGRTVAVLPADSLFEPASATLTPAGMERLKAIIAQLQTTYPNRTVRVEGHADNVPLSAELRERFPTNWELSGARASAVVRHLIEHSDLDRRQFVSVAYGATRPVAPNTTAEGQRRNRRVRVAVLPQPRDYSRPFETAW